MKKLRLIGLVALSLALTGCGTDSTQTNESDQNSKTENSQSLDMASTDQNEESNETIMTQTKNDGPMAYDFKFEDLDGKEYKLSDQRGKKVYIKFWASWCPICMEGMEELDRMFAHAGDKDYEMVTVVTPGQMGEMSKDEFKKWFAELGYDNVKVLLDEEGQILTDYTIRSAPTNILVGSDGVLMGVIPGQLDEKTIDEVFTQIQ